MKHFFYLLIYLVSFTAYSANNSTLWLYRFKIKNTLNVDSVKTIVEKIGGDGEDDCLDIRSVGSSAYSSGLSNNSIVLLSKKQLSPDVLVSIKEKVCPNPEDERCSIEIFDEFYSYDQLKINFSTQGGIPSFSVDLDSKQPLPQASRACHSSLYSDSWNGNRSLSFKNYLIYLDERARHTRTFSLAHMDGSHLYTFGFIEFDIDELIVTDL